MTCGHSDSLSGCIPGTVFLRASISTLISSISSGPGSGPGFSEIEYYTVGYQIIYHSSTSFSIIFIIITQVISVHKSIFLFHFILNVVY